MVLVILCCLFVFLGMYLGKKFNLKYISVNFLFGLFLINAFIQVLPFGYKSLYINYHASTFIFLILAIIIGVALMMLFDYKSDNCDDISIIGFTIINSYVMYLSLDRFNLILFIVNSLYYLFIGIYIRDGRSWISVFIGMIFGSVLKVIGSWWIGYLFAIIFGIIMCFIYSISIIVMRKKGKYCLLSLILGMFVAYLGCVL